MNAIVTLQPSANKVCNKLQESHLSHTQHHVGCCHHLNSNENMRLETCLPYPPNSKWEKNADNVHFISHQSTDTIRSSHNLISKNTHLKNTFSSQTCKTQLTLLCLHYPECKRKISNPVMSEADSNKF